MGRVHRGRSARSNLPACRLLASDYSAALDWLREGNISTTNLLPHLVLDPVCSIEGFEASTGLHEG
jgi:hypothetical protein